MPVERQIDAYLQEPGSEDSVIYPLQYWYGQANQYTDLAALAKKLLVVPATSAPVERVFSHGGLIMRPHRSQLSDVHLSELVFLKCNRLRPGSTLGTK